MSLLENKIDVEDKFFYEFGKPEKHERTKERLNEIVSLGMTVLGYGQFGIKNVMSGLCIEKVWNCNEEAWKNYIEWVNKLKQQKTTENGK